jgi:molybdenum cofactor cytidylyltransferase
MSELAGILLAAGGSERLGRPKQLVRIGGESLVRRQAAMVAGAVDELVVVIGHQAEMIAALLHDQPVRLQRNASWSQGMGTSLAAGISALPAGADAVLVMLCDQYRIIANDLFDLVDAWRAEPTRVVAARWEGACGPPAIFPRSFFAELAMLAGDRGARGLIENPESRTRFVAMDNAQYDLDTQEDLEVLRQRDRY